MLSDRAWHRLYHRWVAVLMLTMQETSTATAARSGRVTFVAGDRRTLDGTDRAGLVAVALQPLDCEARQACHQPLGKGGPVLIVVVSCWRPKLATAGCPTPPIRWG